MRRAVATGASGFIGRHAVAALQAEGWAVTSFVRRARPGLASEQVELGDELWSVESLRDALDVAKPDAVVHLAGLTGALTNQALYEANAVLTANLLEAVRQCRLRTRIVLAGSAAEYGYVKAGDLPVREDHRCAPATVYGISKHAQTLHALAARRSGTDVIVARIFNPIGGGMPPHLALPSFARQIVGAEPAARTIRVGNLDVARDFVDVEDVARILAALASASASEIPVSVLNICSGEAVTLRQLLETMIALSGRMLSPETDPARLRREEAPVLYGDTRALDALGLSVGRPAFDRLLADILGAAIAP